MTTEQAAELINAVRGIQDRMVAFSKLCETLDNLIQISFIAVLCLIAFAFVRGLLNRALRKMETK